MCVAAYTDAKGLIDVIQIPTRRLEGRDADISDLCETVETLQLRVGTCGHQSRYFWADGTVRGAALGFTESARQGNFTFAEV